MTQNTKQPIYYQFPKFLMDVPLGYTARLVYMLIYDRARLSAANGWCDDAGLVYAIYPIAEVAKDMGRSQNTIKTALKELEEHHLLVRKSGGFSKANHLYVQMPDFIGQENKPSESKISLPMKDRKLATNKITETKTNRVKSYNSVRKAGSRRTGHLFEDYEDEKGECL